MFTNTHFTPEERIIEAKIKLQKETPFLYFIICYLKFRMDDKATRTFSVDMDGNVVANPYYVSILTTKQLMAVIGHEALHVAFSHLSRLGGRDLKLWNIAADVKVEQLLKEMDLHTIETFTGENGEVYETINVNNNSFVYGDFKLDNVDTLSVEEIYHALLDQATKVTIPIFLEGFGSKDGEGDGDDSEEETPGKGPAKLVTIDDHDYTKGKGLTEEELKDKANLWKERVLIAHERALTMGTGSAGLNRAIRDLTKPRFNWRRILAQFITSEIFSDYSWNRVSKKSFAMKTVLPGVQKEKLQILAHIDTSGSMWGGELEKVLTELVAICDAFPIIELTFLQGDHEVKDVQQIKGAQIGPYVQSIPFKGGGATTHTYLPEWIEENTPNARLILCFTDGYTTFPAEEKTKGNWIWILTERGIQEDEVPFGATLKITSNSF